jgi:hypothetical protein
VDGNGADAELVQAATFGAVGMQVIRWFLVLLNSCTLVLQKFTMLSG